MFKQNHNSQFQEKSKNEICIVPYGRRPGIYLDRFADIDCCTLGVIGVGFQCCPLATTAGKVNPDINPNLFRNLNPNL